MRCASTGSPIGQHKRTWGESLAADEARCCSGSGAAKYDNLAVVNAKYQSFTAACQPMASTCVHMSHATPSHLHGAS